MNQRPISSRYGLAGMLSDETEEPKAIKLSILEEITDSFSDDLVIGIGGFAVVYKGMLEHGAVAVKRLTTHMHETQFKREVECLMKARHKNIVRFLGYCSDTQGIAATFNENFVIADVQQRLLCFEYLSKGSLHDYIIDDASREWAKCYKIIKGICRGLNYLHEKNIIHLDLKPANILLDNNMEPKIADFGLSRSFGEKQSHETASKVIGTLGYLAPESYNKKITSKLDIYSLGVIILEILTGEKGHCDVKNVLEIWSNRFEKSQINTELEQVRVCAEIGIQCTKSDPAERLDTKKIIGKLDKTEDMYECMETGVSSSSVAQAENDSGELQQGKFEHKAAGETSSKVAQETTELLDIHPMELRFPFEPNKLITCPLYLRNNRDHHVAFRIQPQSQKTAERYNYAWLCGAVPPRSTYTLNVTMKEQKEPPPADKDDILIILSSVISSDKLDMISKRKCDIEYYNFFIEVEAKGIDKVHELKLKAVSDPQGATTTELNQIIRMSRDNKIVSMDVHPTKPWIITSHTKGHFCIWNYETKSMVLKATREQEDMSWDFWTSKFIERKQWIVAGGGDGCIYVYDYNTMEKVTSLKTHSARITSLAIHPTKPYVLAASRDWDIEMWDWEKGPKSARTFKGHKGFVYQIAFNPKDADTFATVSEDKKIKIWTVDSSDAITMTGPGHESKVRCLDYFTRADEQYLITGSDDGTAKIWDLQKKCCIKTLEGHTKRVSTVCSHPMLPLLMTGSLDGTVRLWDSNSFRLKGIHNFGLKEVHALGRIMDGSGRVVIGYSLGLPILAHEDVAISSGNIM